MAVGIFAAVSMIWVDDPCLRSRRSASGALEPIDVEKHDTVWKYVYHDADGNKTGTGGEVQTG